MCGIVGVISKAPVNQLIYDALLLLQHRGQDAAGIATVADGELFVRKGKRLTGLTDPGRELVTIVERLLLDAKNIKHLAAQYANRDETRSREHKGH